jgi:hypothetical protein
VQEVPEVGRPHANWDAEPVVDELASTPLDVIAREHGYTKIAPNLAGWIWQGGLCGP